MKRIVILYMPALHEGYVRFLKTHADEEIYIVSDEILAQITKEIPYYGRDVRAVSSTEMLKAVRGLGINKNIYELDRKTIEEIKNEKGVVVVMPDEDISHEIVSRFFAEQAGAIKFESVFLRWDKKISTTEFQVVPDRIISKNEFDREMIGQAIEEGKKSSDWWRQIGSVLVKDKKVQLFSHNTHFPRPDNVNVLGDPRSNFNAGEYIEVSTAIHSEAALVAEAARRGLSLDGAHLYVSTFPCPNCARLIVRSGIKKIFYAAGYSLVDAEDILKTNNVEIVMVALD